MLDPLEGISESEIAAGADYFSVMRANLADAAEGARMHELSEPVVELDDVSFGYRAGVRVLEDVSLAVAAGEFVAIAGPNGGGKTTLLRLVLGLERPSGGHGARVRPAGRQGRATARASATSRSARGSSARRR